MNTQSTAITHDPLMTEKEMAAYLRIKMRQLYNWRVANSYRGSADDAPILRAVGDQGAQFFKQSFELKIKGDLIPESAVESIIGELQDLFARHGSGAALSAKAVFKPTKDFHTARHTLFSAEQNLEIDKVVPVSASVKTKLGRGGSYED